MRYVVPDVLRKCLDFVVAVAIRIATVSNILVRRFTVAKPSVRCYHVRRCVVALELFQMKAVSVQESHIVYTEGLYAHGLR
jgi:hypothetical protein